MEGKSRSRRGNPFGAEDLAESPPMAEAFADAVKFPSTSSPKRSRKSMHKTVTLIPIREQEGSRLKGEGAPPPPDYWAWRKYGQKPIKGSPYPRGYYKCSSSKGCPARKQVERSRDDPTMLIISYSCEHNHPFPAPRNSSHHHHHHGGAHLGASTATAKGATDDALIEPETDMSTPDPEAELDPEPETEPEGKMEASGKFADVKEEQLLMPADDGLGWFTDMEITAASSFMERPLFDSKVPRANDDMTLLFPMTEEEESLFADLGELPECTVVFRHGRVGTQVQIY
ncbi:hypothetical protein SAY87_030506 [Trapa incisa]|uniref:WRKY domain-containing protein n=1 Tax=Trapa incisa TaxID=236973 RepID=A0AAN7KPD2_9MYRT|nr:hypothetical protein SAY87_030506 [Trapa incisa]